MTQQEKVLWSSSTLVDISEWPATKAVTGKVKSPTTLEAKGEISMGRFHLTKLETKKDRGARSKPS